MPTLENRLPSPLLKSNPDDAHAFPNSQITRFRIFFGIANRRSPSEESIHFYGTRMHITIFTEVHQETLFWANSVWLKIPDSIFLTPIFILPSHLCLNRPTQSDLSLFYIFTLKCCIYEGESVNTQRAVKQL